ncbi:unnamed protein product, partial [Discosporangium mesarthrocarpum]
RLKELHGYQSVVMIGDGATDLQAKPLAEAFVGYGGVTVRPSVREGADWFVYHFRELSETLLHGARTSSSSSSAPVQ